MTNMDTWVGQHIYDFPLQRCFVKIIGLNILKWLKSVKHKTWASMNAKDIGMVYRVVHSIAGATHLLEWKHPPCEQGQVFTVLGSVLRLRIQSLHPYFSTDVQSADTGSFALVGVFLCQYHIGRIQKKLSIWKMLILFFCMKIISKCDWWQEM